MIKVGLIGVGKMGLSHYAILGAHPDVQVSAICDNATYITSALKKRIGVETFKDFDKMIDQAGLDAVFVATPTATHFPAASYALERGLHVFVEKPLCLDPEQSKRLADLARAKKRANQVGYHNRFIGTFQEVRRLVQAGALGDVYQIGGTAYGQVVIKAKTGITWRSKKAEGGGCLHDYASHVVDLMNFVLGAPERVLSAHLRSVFSKDVEDVVNASFEYPRRCHWDARNELERRDLPEDEHDPYGPRHEGQNRRRPPGVQGVPAQRRRFREVPRAAGPSATSPISRSR